MKNIFKLILCLFLCLFISSCEEINNNNNPPSGSFKLTIIDKDNFIYDKPKESYYTSGSIIKLHSHVINDVDLAMYVNGKFYSIEKEKDTGDDYIWEYEFEMLDSNVDIEFKILSFNYPQYTNYYEYVMSESMKGLEIYCYKDLLDNYNFVMMLGTNRLKTATEVQDLIDNESLSKIELLDILSYALEDSKQDIFLYLISNPVTEDELTHSLNEEQEEILASLYLELGLRSIE